MEKSQFDEFPALHMVRLESKVVRGMPMEAIQRVTQAEEAARRQLEEAQTACRRILSAAQEEARHLTEEAAASAEEFCES